MENDRNNKRVLVTGGAGYIGSHCAKDLHNMGFLPVCYDDLSTGRKRAVKWGPFLEGSLQNTSLLVETIKEYKPIAVMHFAASAIIKESIYDPLKYYENNMRGTLSLLEAMKKTGVKNLIFSSSCSTYGHPKSHLITEEHSTLPFSPYGKSKLMAENMIQDFSYAYDIRHISLRYFNAAGADYSSGIGEDHDIETRLIPVAMQKILRGEKVSIFGTDFPTEDGTAIRDYIHVEDISKGHLLALFYLLKEKKSHTINLGSGKGYSVLEVVKMIERITKMPVDIEYHPIREGDPSHLVADFKKAKKILNWEPKKSDLCTIIETAWNWQKWLHEKKEASY